MVRRQVQHRRYVVQLLTPVSQLILEHRVGQPLALPHTEVAILNRQLRERRLFAVDPWTSEMFWSELANVPATRCYLVVVDEEQRFGVKHKDALKEKFRLVDVLTLSATPIPRTLYLSLMGARDMSVIETPPPNRLPVETVVCGYDERVIRDAVKRELARGGQVYFLHNRVQSIERVANRIRELVKDARVTIGQRQPVIVGIGVGFIQRFAIFIGERV